MIVKSLEKNGGTFVACRVFVLRRNGVNCDALYDAVGSYSSACSGLAAEAVCGSPARDA